jgi:hypothetical protein
LNLTKASRRCEHRGLPHVAQQYAVTVFALKPHAFQTGRSRVPAPNSCRRDDVSHLLRYDSAGAHHIDAEHGSVNRTPPTNPASAALKYDMAIRVV